jgi:hypothetical protein
MPMNPGQETPDPVPKMIRQRALVRAGVDRAGGSALGILGNAFAQGASGPYRLSQLTVRHRTCLAKS